jgi:GT2 family glycosyltransferase
VKSNVVAIIVTYNGMKWIDRCLTSLINSSLAVDIIVIDNLSSDETVPHIQTYYPQAELLCMKQNLGFGSGNNEGLKLAMERKADFVFLLNQDAWVETDTIKNLLDAQREHPQYGILSPVHLNGTGSNFDDHFYEYLLRAEDKKLLQCFLAKKEVGKVILK